MKRRWFAIILFFVAVILAGWLVGSYFSLESLAKQEQSIHGLVAEHPFITWVLGFFIYVGISLVPGTRGKAIAAGWLFGLWSGLVLVNFALTLAALIGFLISRYLLRDAVAGRYPARVERGNRAIEKNGALCVLLLRVVPVSFSLTNYVLGATKVKTKTYWWATQLGLLPGNFIFVNAGAQLPSLNEVVTRGWSVLLTWESVSGLVLLSCFTLFTPWLISRWSHRTKNFARQSAE